MSLHHSRDGVTRRDFLEGVAVSLGAPLPALAGMQGQTDALSVPAHHLRDGKAASGVAERDEGVEDLVVVGAGISGLAGAWLFRQHAGRPVRVLVLDALNEVGGHARRNEFVSRSGRRMVGYGGSQSLDSPSLFSPAVQALLRAVGIELMRFETEFFDHDWAKRHGLTNRSVYFGRQTWGDERLVQRRAGEAAADWLPRTPLPPLAQADLQRLLGTPHNVLPGLNRAALVTQLASITYAEFLRRHWRMHAAVQVYMQHTTLGYLGVGIDAASALDAWALGLPGFDGLDLGDTLDARLSPSSRKAKASQDGYVYHFPDGNHGVVRALLRALRPELLPGQGMETLPSAVLDTAALDDAAADVRVRLRSTVLGLRHLGPPQRAELVELRYVDSVGHEHLVNARQVLLACWHRVIPRLTDELPRSQLQALNDQVKVPLLYTTVLLSNWTAWKRAGTSAIETPGGFWQDVGLDFPVSMGDIRYPSDPSEPMLVHLAKVVVPGDGRNPRAQSAAGRKLLHSWSFDFLEGEVRQLLQGALGGYGFDASHDIEAITVNRWAHGYTYEYMRPWDRFWPRGPLPNVAARRGWGRVAIAGTDSAANAYAHAAIDEATRAVQELLPLAKLPAWAAFPGPEPRTIGL